MSVETKTIRLEYVSGKSDKFYQLTENIYSDRTEVITVYGRNGTPGSSFKKEFVSPAGSYAYFTKMVNEKKKKGYKEVRA